MDANNLNLKGQAHGLKLRSTAQSVATNAAYIATTCVEGAARDARSIAQGTKRIALCGFAYVRGVFTGVAAR